MYLKDVLTTWDLLLINLFTNVHLRCLWPHALESIQHFCLLHMSICPLKGTSSKLIHIFNHLSYVLFDETTFFSEVNHYYRERLDIWLWWSTEHEGVIIDHQSLMDFMSWAWLLHWLSVQSGFVGFTVFVTWIFIAWKQKNWIEIMLTVDDTYERRDSHSEP